MANGRVKGQISLGGAKTVRNSRNPAFKNPHTTSTVGVRGAKATKNTHRPRVHSRPSSQQENLNRTAASKTSSNLRNDNPHTVNTVGLRGAKVPSNKGTSSNLRKTSPRAVNSQGLTRASKRAPRQSLQSSGTGILYSGRGTKVPFAGNRRQVGPSPRVVSDIPAVVRRAASRKAPGGGAGAGKVSFTTRIAKILSK